MPILNHNRLSGCKTRGKADAARRNARASPNAQSRGPRQESKGQAAIIAKTAANTSPNDRSDEALTSARVKLSCVPVSAMSGIDPNFRRRSICIFLEYRLDAAIPGAVEFF